MHKADKFWSHDDLYAGANTPEELDRTWELLLSILAANNLKLSASKTVIASKSTMLLSWIWKSGSLTPSQHKISPLESVPEFYHRKGKCLKCKIC